MDNPLVEKAKVNLGSVHVLDKFELRVTNEGIVDKIPP